jgi:two-component system, LytTR family, sensor kinase
LGWIFYITYTLANTIQSSPSRKIHFWDFFLYYFADVFIFYILSLFSFSKLFNRNRRLEGFAIFILGIVGYYLIQQSRLYAKIWSFGPTEIIPSYYYNIFELLLAFMPNLIQYVAFALLYWFYQYSIQQQKEKLELEQHNHQIEISFLKSQIQEHFTYNMLSMFHSEALKYSDKLANGLQMLSALMRYSVSEQENTMVTLDEEIKYIQSLLTLSKMRLDKTTEVHFEITGNTQAWRVPHLGLLTLVENALKHGAMKQGLYDLQLSAGPEELVFSTKNMKREKTEEISTGIGLKNLERRLQLLTKGKSVLHTHEDGKYFYTNLKISI